MPLGRTFTPGARRCRAPGGRIPWSPRCSSARRPGRSPGTRTRAQAGQLDGRVLEPFPDLLALRRVRSTSTLCACVVRSSTPRSRASRAVEDRREVPILGDVVGDDSQLASSVDDPRVRGRDGARPMSCRMSSDRSAAQAAGRSASSRPSAEQLVDLPPRPTRWRSAGRRGWKLVSGSMPSW